MLKVDVRKVFIIKSYVGKIPLPDTQARMLLAHFYSKLTVTKLLVNWRIDLGVREVLVWGSLKAVKMTGPLTPSVCCSIVHGSEEVFILFFFFYIYIYIYIIISYKVHFNQSKHRTVEHYRHHKFNRNRKNSSHYIVSTIFEFSFRYYHSSILIYLDTPYGTFRF